MSGLYIIKAHLSELSAKDQMKWNRVFKGYMKFDKRVGTDGKEYKHSGLASKAEMLEWIGSGMFYVMCNDDLLGEMKEYFAGLGVKADVYFVSKKIEW